MNANASEPITLQEAPRTSGRGATLSATPGGPGGSARGHERTNNNNNNDDDDDQNNNVSGEGQAVLQREGERPMLFSSVGEEQRTTDTIDASGWLLYPQLWGSSFLH